MVSTRLPASPPPWPVADRVRTRTPSAVTAAVTCHGRRRRRRRQQSTRGLEYLGTQGSRCNRRRRTRRRSHGPTPQAQSRAGFGLRRRRCGMRAHGAGPSRAWPEPGVGAVCAAVPAGFSVSSGRRALAVVVDGRRVRGGTGSMPRETRRRASRACRACSLATRAVSLDARDAAAAFSRGIRHDRRMTRIADSDKAHASFRRRFGAGARAGMRACRGQRAARAVPDAGE